METKSLRLPDGVFQILELVAARRGVKPMAMARELVVEGLKAQDAMFLCEQCGRWCPMNKLSETTLDDCYLCKDCMED